MTNQSEDQIKAIAERMARAAFAVKLGITEEFPLNLADVSLDKDAKEYHGISPSLNEARFFITVKLFARNGEWRGGKVIINLRKEPDTKCEFSCGPIPSGMKAQEDFTAPV